MTVPVLEHIQQLRTDPGSGEVLYGATSVTNGTVRKLRVGHCTAAKAERSGENRVIVHSGVKLKAVLVDIINLSCVEIPPIPSTTIKIFPPDGDPKRLRTAEMSNWTAKAGAVPRRDFDNMLAREESHKSEVYFLTCIDPETRMNAVYIGEAESRRDRVKVQLSLSVYESSNNP